MTMLKTAYGGKKGESELMMDAYWEAYNATKRGVNGTDLRELIISNVGYTPERLTSFEQRFYRRFTKHRVNFSYKRISMIVLLVAEVLEEIIASLLKNQVACALSDGWFRDAVHYVCLHASFIHDEGGPEEEHMVLLLDVSLMACREVDDVAIQDEAQAETKDGELNYFHRFDAEIMLAHFEDITSVYNQEFQTLFAGITWDNTEVNRKCAKLAKLPHLPYLNHTHALDIHTW